MLLYCRHWKLIKSDPELPPTRDRKRHCHCKWLIELDFITIVTAATVATKPAPTLDMTFGISDSQHFSRVVVFVLQTTYRVTMIPAHVHLSRVKTLVNLERHNSRHIAGSLFISSHWSTTGPNNVRGVNNVVCCWVYLAEWSRGTFAASWQVVCNGCLVFEFPSSAQKEDK